MTLCLRFIAVFSLLLPWWAQAQPAYVTRALPSGVWDLRFGAEADVLLAHAAANAGAEVGMMALGDGSLAVGVEAALGHCLLSCGSGGGLQVERWSVTPMARLVWHYVVGGETANVAEVDLYAVAMGGVGFAFQEARRASASLSSSELLPVFGAGLGSVYFPGAGDVIFAGGELRVLYAPATRALGLTDPAGPQLSAWSLGGVRFLFTMGVRL